MKVRAGFVSNSSSCSFLVLGAVLNKEQLLKGLKKDTKYLEYLDKYADEDKAAHLYVDEELGLDYREGEESGMREDEVCIGSYLGDIEEGDEYDIASMQELIESAESIAKYLNSIGIDEVNIKLFTGVEMC